MLDLCELWFKRAKPSPTEADFNLQLGCHFEEFGEMLEAITAANDEDTDLRSSLVEFASTMHLWADAMKSGKLQVKISNRKELLDALADQMVTAIGVGYMAGMKPVEAFNEANSSNWTKFEDGIPVFKPNGKIGKGRDYREPNLEGMY